MSEEAVDEDALLPNPDLPIRLPMFEGPLDLLLFLIRRNEVDIYDIPIEQVTHQYLTVLHEMEELNLEVAGDFFVMAATLMYIKSRMLLPTNEQAIQPEDEAEEADPRWELVQQLLEYKRFKEAATEIRDLIEQQQDFLPRIYSEAVDQLEVRPLKSSDRIEIWNTFNNVLRRLAEQITQGEIQDDTVTVADRMEFLLEIIQTKSSFRFSELFKDQVYSLNMLVSTFLAVLELTRLKKMTVAQDELFGDIACHRRDDEGDGAADHGVSGESDESEGDISPEEEDNEELSD
ncbi:segregation and condensation protein A [Rubellicoccus peritrichatus]|uniref:Segregation and condensation protein A n=1 Tax=Rubellicoccus peritrichatus TaxID=3080537 RepID=A0AAQ3QRU5_9BACT|nr:segregation/condensation protein A [Puniceicoccus sp. CR14]WOO41648.1 segregation/condensation protein A [Puniceicoccus sp. CR14]